MECCLSCHWHHLGVHSAEARVCDPGLGTASSGASSGATALGSAKNPLYMMQAEPTARAQLWRTFRTLALALLIMSGLGALVEERGLSRGILNNPDLRPQTETRTRFADVKGVDEAKVPQLCPLRAHLHVLCSAWILFGSNGRASVVWIIMSGLLITQSVTTLQPPENIVQHG